MARIPYLLIRNIDPQTYNRVRKIAELRRKPLAETASELLRRHFIQQSGNDTKGRPALRAKPKLRRI